MGKTRKNINMKLKSKKNKSKSTNKNKLNQIGKGKDYSDELNVLPSIYNRVLGKPGGYGLALGDPRPACEGEGIEDVVDKQEVSKLFKNERDGIQEMEIFTRLLQDNLRPFDYIILESYILKAIKSCNIDVSLLKNPPYGLSYFKNMDDEEVDSEIIKNIFKNISEVDEINSTKKEGETKLKYKNVFSIVYPKGLFPGDGLVYSISNIYEFLCSFIYLQNVLYGIYVLNENKILHGDIKLANIMARSYPSDSTTPDIDTMRFNLIDFGDVRKFNRIQSGIPADDWLYSIFTPLNIFRRCIFEDTSLTPSKRFRPLTPEMFIEAINGSPIFPFIDSASEDDRKEYIASVFSRNSIQYKRLRTFFNSLLKREPSTIPGSGDTLNFRRVILEEILSQRLLCTIFTKPLPDIPSISYVNDLHKYIFENGNAAEYVKIPGFIMLINNLNTYFMKLFESSPDGGMAVLKEINKRIDIYSFGFCLLEILGIYYIKILNKFPQSPLLSYKINEIINQIYSIVEDCCIIKFNPDGSLVDLNISAIIIKYHKLINFIRILYGHSLNPDLIPMNINELNSYPNFVRQHINNGGGVLLFNTHTNTIYGAGRTTIRVGEPDYPDAPIAAAAASSSSSSPAVLQPPPLEKGAIPAGAAAASSSEYSLTGVPSVYSSSSKDLLDESRRKAEVIKDEKELEEFVELVNKPAARNKSLRRIDMLEPEIAKLRRETQKKEREERALRRGGDIRDTDR